MKSGLETIKRLYESSEKKELEDYFTLLRFQSISSEMEHQQDVRDCALWLKNYLNDLEFETELWETTGHPVVFGSHMKAGPGKPTLLIYHHYDVQPVDPIELWNSPPFEPTVRNGEVYARGAEDNKGQCFFTLQALKQLLKRDGELPLNVKICIEGEEEIGSAGLSSLLKEKSKSLQADHVAIVDAGIRTPDTPALSLGVRGMVTMEVALRGSSTDLHSGSHGGIAFNPIHALVSVLAKLRDRNGKITIPGFYDAVKALTTEERNQLSLEFDAEKYKEDFGAKPSGGEKELSPLERAWLRPTIEINGIYGGYTGSGFKTVIPALAHAKISCRLVPNQDPQEIGRLVSDFFRQHVPGEMEVKITIHPGVGVAARSDVSSEVVQAFSQAFGEIFQKPTKYILEGGSIPIVNELQQASGGAIALVGLGLPDDKIHAPNEHFGIDRIKKGCLLMARTMEILGRH